jgi:hypothetical protein
MSEVEPVVPDSLRSEWIELSACEQAMAQALDVDDMEELSRQTDRRHELIVHFFDVLLPAQPHSAELRAALLGTLLQRNEALLHTSHQRLAQVGNASLQAAHSRKAIGAYQAHETGNHEES